LRGGAGLLSRGIGALGGPLGTAAVAAGTGLYGMYKGMQDARAQRDSIINQAKDDPAWEANERQQWYAEQGKQAPDLNAPAGGSDWLRGARLNNPPAAPAPYSSPQNMEPLGPVKKVEGSNVSYGNWRSTSAPSARLPSPGGPTMVGMSNDRPVLGGGNLRTMGSLDRQGNVTPGGVQSANNFRSSAGSAPEFNQSNYKPKYADGGYIDPRLGPPGTDTIPAVVANKTPVKLDGGEYVLPEDTVDKLGVRNLDALVAKTHTPQKKNFADGGIVPGSFYDVYPREKIGEMRGPRSDALYSAGSAMEKLLPSTGDSLKKLGSGMRLKPRNYVGTTAEIAALTVPYGPKGIAVGPATGKWVAQRQNASQFNSPIGVGRWAGQNMTDDDGIYFLDEFRKRVAEEAKKEFLRGPQGRLAGRIADESLQRSFQLARGARDFTKPDSLRKLQKSLAGDARWEGDLAKNYVKGVDMLKLVNPLTEVPPYAAARGAFKFQKQLGDKMREANTLQQQGAKEALFRKGLESHKLGDAERWATKGALLANENLGKE
jgi:hypothetical protein